MMRYAAGLGLVLMLLSGGVAAEPAAPLTLAHLEELARQHNPTLVQAAALLAGAEGRQMQAGQLPRTTLGYEAEDVLLAEPGEAKHALFFEQRFPAGLSAQRALRAAEREEMLAQAEAQRRRVLTSLRQLYYRALAAQEELRLRHELLTVAREAETTTRRLFNVGQADQPDVLAIALEAAEEALRREEAESGASAAWSALAAMVGQPDLPRSPLAGSLPGELPELDLAALRATLLSDHPTLAMARSRVARSEALARSARAESSPEFSLRAELGYSGHEAVGGGEEGWLAGLELGLALPLFRSNRGALAAAAAERQRAEAEVRRLELLLGSRFDEAAARYRSRRAATEQYQTRLVPLAEQALALYEESFRKMTAAYPQVLVARRRLAHLRLDLNRAALALHETAIWLDGLLLGGGLEPPHGPGGVAELLPAEGPAPVAEAKE